MHARSLMWLVLVVCMVGQCTILLAEDEGEIVKGLKSLEERGARITYEQVGDKSVVKEILLCRKEFGDADLAFVGKIKSLRSLNLQISKVTDAGLKHLTGLDQLQQLDLYQTDITPGAYEHLAALKSLNYLGLPREQPNDETLPLLMKWGLAHKLSTAYSNRGRPASVNDVTGIQVEAWNLSEKGLRQLAAFKSLTSLGNAPEQVTDGALRIFSELGVLHALRDAEGFPNNNGRRAGKDEAVIGLRLDSPHVTAAGMKELTAFRGLKTLSVTKSNLDDAAMKEIVKFKELELLHLNAKITDEGLKVLTQLPRLRVLWLQEGSAVTDAGVKSIAQVKTLETLFIYGTRITPAGLKELKGSPLRAIHLSREQINDDVVRELNGIGLLHTLSFAFGQGGRPKSLDTVFWLRIQGTRVSDVGLREFTGMTSLRGIELSNTLVTDEGVAELQKALPQVKISR